MPGRLRILPAAALHVDEQAQYYREESGSALAMRWKQQANLAARSLQVLPERGPPCNFQAAELAGLRKLAIQGFPNHFIYYRYDASSYTVPVVAVLPGARDLETQLRLLASQKGLER